MDIIFPPFKLFYFITSVAMQQHPLKNATIFKT